MLAALRLGWDPISSLFDPQDAHSVQDKDCMQQMPTVLFCCCGHHVALKQLLLTGLHTAVFFVNNSNVKHNQA